MKTASDIQVLNIIKQSQHFSQAVVAAAQKEALNRNLVTQEELPFLMNQAEYQTLLDSLWDIGHSNQEVIQILKGRGLSERLATRWIEDYKNMVARKKRYQKEDRQDIRRGIFSIFKIFGSI